MPLLVHDIPAATAVLYAVGASAFAAEALATHIGTAPEATSLRGRLRALRTSVTTVAFTRKQGSARTLDRGTKRILLLGVWAALAVEWVSAAALPGLRAGANTWPTLIAGALLAMSGIALRAGSVWTL